MQTITRVILPRNQSPSVSNSQGGRSCEQIFDSSTTFLNPLVRTNSLYGKRTVGFFSLGRVRLARFARVRLLRHGLPISSLILRKKPTVLQSTYGRWSFIRIEPQGVCSEKSSRHIYNMEDNLCMQRLSLGSMLSLKFLVYSNRSLSNIVHTPYSENRDQQEP